MNTRKYILTIVFGALTAALSMSASAQIFNPDNDSATFFKYNPQAPGATRAVERAPVTGSVSADGLYVYSGGERGWVNRQHSYRFVAGSVVHTEDCLPYSLPAPARVAGSLERQGPFADHGA